MPGYGLRGPDEGTGLLPWSWAEERLTESRNYWVVSLWPDGRPHAMPVWVYGDGERFWFSSSVSSRKATNLRRDPRCVVTAEDATRPVVIEGKAELVTNHEDIAHFLEATNAKYSSDITIDFLDPDVNATIAVWPSWAFGLVESDFTGSPTRWRFG